MADLFDQIHAAKGDVFDQIHSTAATPKAEESALSKLGAAFWEGIGGKAAMDILGGRSGNPESVKRAKDTAQSLVNGLKGEPSRVWQELSKSGEAMTHGDVSEAASHLGGAVPFVGAGAQQVQHDFENKDYATGFGHALALLLPFAAKGTAGVMGDAAEAGKSALSSTAGKVADVGTSIAGNQTLRDIGTVVAPEMPRRIQAAGRLAAKLPLADRLRTAIVGSEESAPTGALPAKEAARRAELARLAKFDRDAARQQLLEDARRESPNANQEPAVPQEAQIALPSGRVPGTGAPRTSPAETGAPPAPAAKPRTLAQTESAMSAVKTEPATEAPGRSPYAASGEPKSPALKAAEIKGANIDQKAQRWADALFQSGFDNAQAISKIPAGRVTTQQIQQGAVPAWENVTDHLIQKGLLKAGEKPPMTSIPKIQFFLKKMQAAKIAQDLLNEMTASGTIQ